jgi:8-oxo-dGTP pyrophosphatase MutT (NUDIX family)
MKFRDIITGELKILPQNTVATTRISAYALIEHDKTFLLIKDGRSQKWEFPGGGVDDAENLVEGLSREVLEETGFTISDEHDILCVMKDYIYHPVKDKYYITLGLFYTTALKSTAKQELNLDTPDEIVGQGWFSKEDIPNLDILAMHKIAFYKFSSKFTSD